MWDLSKPELPPIAFCEIGSASESTAVLLVKQQEDDFAAHNVEHLTRVYPSGKRYDSSNLSVFPLWRAGVQSAALNMQTPCINTQANQALFTRNGFSGSDSLVPRPSVMRVADTVSSSRPCNLWRRCEHHAPGTKPACLTAASSSSHR